MKNEWNTNFHIFLELESKIFEFCKAKGNMEPGRHSEFVYLVLYLLSHELKNKERTQRPKKKQGGDICDIKYRLQEVVYALQLLALFLQGT